MRRVGLVLGTAAAAVLGGMPTTWAQNVQYQNETDWGTVIPDGGCAQANAWLLAKKKLGGVIDIKVHEAHYPATAAAPENAGGNDIINLPLLAQGSKLYTRTSGGVVSSSGQPDTSVKCAAYAEAGGKSIDVGAPYAPALTPGGVQMSAIGFHLEKVKVTAQAVPGKPVELNKTAVGGYVSSFGHKIKEFTKGWPVNSGVRIPADYSKAPLAEVMTNEQVTTDSNGQPTLDSNGEYYYDPSASSGYINALHVSLLGQAVKDLTVKHAAVLTTAGRNLPCAVPDSSGRCAHPR